MQSADPPFAEPPPLLSAGTFDFIPPLHALLSRLLVFVSEPQRAPLSPKDLATEAAAVKIKLQHARMVVEGLPDVDREVGEQEAEIAELEMRVERQREMLWRVVGAAKSSVTGR